MSNRSRLAALLALFSASVAPHASAQTDDVAAPPEGGTEVAPPAAPDPQVEALAARSQQTEERLQAALARIDALEEAQAAHEAEEAEEDAAEESSPWTLRPLVSSFSRLEVREGYDAIGATAPGCTSGDGDCFRWRARLGLDVGLDLSDDVNVRARFLPEFAGFWAVAPGVSGGVADPNLGVHEASLLFQVRDVVGIELGRFELDYGDDVVLGNLDWHPSARSFDGARVLIRSGGVALDTFFTVLQESLDPEPGRSDRYFYGVYAALGGLVDDATVLDVYVLGLQSNNSFDPASGASVGWSQRTHIGARFKRRFGILDVRTEGGLQVGRQGMPEPADAELVLAGHVLADVGLFLASDRLRFSIEGAYASGDDPDTAKVESYNQLFPTAHAFLGLTDVMGGRSNIATGVFHAQFKALDTLILRLDAHAFARPQNAGEAYAGFETDLNVIWKPLPGFRARAMAGLFIPNEDFWGNDEVVRYVEVEAGYDFR